MDKEERLSRQMEFCREIDKEKQILRQTILSNGIQREDDSQHAWHMAVMTLLLSEYSNEPIDVLKTISMLFRSTIWWKLMQEIRLPMTRKEKKTQRERELRAADRIFSILPEDQRDKFRSLWDEFEEGTSPEALFAHTMDNLQPTMLNAATNGKMWKEKQVRLSGILNRNKTTALGSETLWKYSLEQLIRPHVEGGQIIDDTEGRHN